MKHSFMIKTLSKLEIEGNFLNLVKNICKKLQLILYINGTKLEAFPLRSGTRQGYPFSPFLFNIILEVLTNAIRQEKEIKGTQIGKEEIKLFLFIYDKIVYKENWKDSTKKLLELIKDYSKFAGYKVNIQKSITFQYNSNEQAEFEIKNTIPLGLPWWSSG